MKGRGATRTRLALALAHLNHLSASYDSGHLVVLTLRLQDMLSVVPLLLVAAFASAATLEHVIKCQSAYPLAFSKTAASEQRCVALGDLNACLATVLVGNTDNAVAAGARATLDSALAFNQDCNIAQSKLALRILPCGLISRHHYSSQDICFRND